MRIFIELNYIIIWQKNYSLFLDHKKGAIAKNSEEKNKRKRKEKRDDFR
jgi:hypothetical protein